MLINLISHLQSNFIYGFSDNITTFGYKEDVGIIYYVCANEQREFLKHVIRMFILLF